MLLMLLVLFTITRQLFLYRVVFLTGYFWLSEL